MLIIFQLLFWRPSHSSVSRVCSLAPFGVCIFYPLFSFFDVSDFPYSFSLLKIFLFISPSTSPNSWIFITLYKIYGNTGIQWPFDHDYEIHNKSSTLLVKRGLAMSFGISNQSRTRTQSKEVSDKWFYPNVIALERIGAFHMFGVELTSFLIIRPQWQVICFEEFLTVECHPILVMRFKYEPF